MLLIRRVKFGRGVLNSKLRTVNPEHQKYLKAKRIEFLPGQMEPGLKYRQVVFDDVFFEVDLEARVAEPYYGMVL